MLCRWVSDVLGVSAEPGEIGVLAPRPAVALLPERQAHTSHPLGIDLDAQIVVERTGGVRQGFAGLCDVLARHTGQHVAASFCLSWRRAAV